MKKQISFIVCLFVSFWCLAQDCPPNCNFYTQSQIDSFPVNYPNCTEIEGTVLIDGTDIDNLTGLNSLISISGDLLIGVDDGDPHNYSLTNLEGLNNLTSIGGSLNINSNLSLTILSGLENLMSIGEDLIIHHNPHLKRLTGLNNVTTVGENLTIHWNDSLLNLSGLNSLGSIGGYLRIGRAWQYQGNISLTSLTGLEALTSIGGDLVIGGNYSLTDITSIANIDPGSVSNLRIIYNISLNDCNLQNICNYLANPNGLIDINNNGAGCKSPIEVSMACGVTSPCLPYGLYYFSSQSDIDNFQNIYPGCADLNGKVTIHGSNITNLNGLNVVNSVGGSLRIEYCDSLTSLAGLENLDSIGGDFYINNNNALTSLNGLTGLSSIEDYFFIENNNSLTSLVGLEDLDSTGYLSVIGNPILPDLTGLENLNFIEKDLYISSNEKLKNISALDNLTSNVRSVDIYNNRSLTSLTGLDNIASISDLYIIQNEILSTCEVQSICDFLASPNGTIDIQDNATGCNSLIEVESACGVGFEEVVTHESLFSIYPNPSSAQFTIEARNPINQGFIDIFSMNGLKVYHCRITEPKMIIDISYLPSGVYFVRFTCENEVRMFKVVKY